RGDGVSWKLIIRLTAAHGAIAAVAAPPCYFMPCISSAARRAWGEYLDDFAELVAGLAADGDHAAVRPRPRRLSSCAEARLRRRPSPPLPPAGGASTLSLPLRVEPSGDWATPCRSRRGFFLRAERMVRPRQPQLSIKQILSRADDHREQTGSRPNAGSGVV